MPRVAIVEYLMSSGGLERVLRGLARAFLEIPEAKGWDITFLLSRYDTAHRLTRWPEELEGPGLRVEWLGQDGAGARMLSRLAHFQGDWNSRHLRVAAGLGARAIRSAGPLAWRSWAGDPAAALEAASRRFDLLFFVFPGTIRPPRFQCPVVTSPADFNYRHFLREGSSAWRRQDLAMRAWLAASDRILFTSQAVFDEMLEAYREAAPLSRVVRLGVDTGSPPPSPEAVEATRTRYRLPREFALVSGWIMPHKGQLTLVEAAARLRSSGRPIPLVFVGPNSTHLTDSPVRVRRTPYARQVAALLAERGMEPGRDFLALGYVSDADLACLYRLASLYVVPSLYEGFGLPSLEALQAGCPTVVSAIPPLEEQSRLLGLDVPTFPPGDAVALAGCMAAVLDRPDAGRAAARLAAERLPAAYDWRRTAREYLEHFAEVLAAARRVGGEG